ncbi:chromosome partitioning protein ParA, partial [Vibrio sp. S234-5]
DLNFRDHSAELLGLPLGPVKEAVAHLNQSQRYIEQRFSADEVIFAPLNTRLSNIMIKKKDWRGRACALDVRQLERPDYRTPIGEMSYETTAESGTKYPSLGD